MVGHFRHESGHYYWDRLVAGRGSVLAGFRRLFGDEQADYQQALDRHYSEDPPAHWQERFITVYASMHPWEDWAETWAHYLHLVDTLETAGSVGVEVATMTAAEPGLAQFPSTPCSPRGFPSQARSTS